MCFVIGFIGTRAFLQVIKSDKEANKPTVTVETTQESQKTTTEINTSIITSPTTTTVILTTTTPILTTTQTTTKKPETTTKKITTYKSSATEEIITENNTEEIQWVEFNCSAYCTCTVCTNGGGITASGTVPKADWTIAASKNYPFGTLIYIEGYGTYCVEDRGGAINNNKLDLYFATHQEACNFGRRYLKGYVVRWGYGNGDK